MQCLVPDNADTESNPPKENANVKIDSEVVDSVETNKEPVLAHARNDAASVQRVSDADWLKRIFVALCKMKNCACENLVS